MEIKVYHNSRHTGSGNIVYNFLLASHAKSNTDTTVGMELNHQQEMNLWTSLDIVTSECT